MELPCKLIRWGKKDKKTRLSAKKMGRLYRLTTTTVTVVKNLLKLLACQIREILESLEQSDTILQASNQANKSPTREKAWVKFVLLLLGLNKMFRDVWGAQLLGQQVGV